MDHKMKSVWKTECHLSAGSSWITIVVGVVMTLAAVVGVKSYKMCIKNRQKHSELCDVESESSVELQAHVQSERQRAIVTVVSSEHQLKYFYTAANILFIKIQDKMYSNKTG